MIKSWHTYAYYLYSNRFMPIYGSTFSLFCLPIEIFIGEPVNQREGVVPPRGVSRVSLKEPICLVVWLLSSCLLTS